MGPSDLAHVLRHLTTVQHPDLLVGLQVADDAAVWRLDEARALVQTVDFFTPIVDDPYTYGAIAAANALSDVYAMGGTPFLALAIAAFPSDLPPELLADIFRGGAAKAAEAGVVIAGGHTVTDAEPKYGLAVTGMVHPQRILTKGAVQAGDHLFLTKPIGTGVITTALKRERAALAHVEAAVESMLRLNGPASRVLAEFRAVRACTDVTGFGLAGHAYEMAAASGVCLEFEAEAVPLLPGALEYIAADFLPGGADRNRSYFTTAEPPAEGAPAEGAPAGAAQPRVTLADGASPTHAAAFFDPQTSGGLLFAVPQEHTETIGAAFRSADLPLWRVGRAVPGYGVRIV